MNEKEELVLKVITEYVKENTRIPTMRYIQKKLNYKSVNSIERIIKVLEDNNYLIRNKENKLILSKYSGIYNGLKIIKVINENNKYIHMILNKRNKYIAYKIKNNYFKDLGIFKNDLLIIRKDKNINNNDLGLFIIDNKYRIMKYNYQDGFYILCDYEELLLNKVKLIGKVIMVEKILSKHNYTKE